MIRKALFTLMVIALLGACVKTAPSPVQPMATATPPAVASAAVAPSPSSASPSPAAPTQTPAPSLVPTLPMLTEALAPINYSARVGLDDSDPYWLTYDSNIWVSEPNPQNVYARFLMHKNLAGCELRQDLGHGAPETWQPFEEKETIGKTEFQVQRWTLRASGEWQLVSYFWDDTRKQLMIMPGEDPALCMQAAREVIRLSESVGFASIVRP